MAKEISERMKAVFAASRERAKNPPDDDFGRELYRAAERYAELPLWAKQARAMADAVVSQRVWIEPDDRLIGRTFHSQTTLPIEKVDFDLSYKYGSSQRPRDEVLDPAYEELCKNQLANHGTPGHISWRWDTLLALGTDGMRENCRLALARHQNDPKGVEFYSGVMIMLDALDAWNEKHVEELLRISGADSGKRIVNERLECGSELLGLSRFCNEELVINVSRYESVNALGNRTCEYGLNTVG